MDTKNILISFSGLGFGNSTRMLAVTKSLHDHYPSAQIHLCTWGNAYNVLRDEPLPPYVHVHPLLRYGKFSWLYVFIANCFRLFKLRLKLRPFLVVQDSDYHFLSFVARSFPLVFVGQTLDVLHRAKQYGYKPVSVRAHIAMFFRERLDFYVQCVFCDFILVPSFFPISRQGKVIPIPLIVRDEFNSEIKKSGTAILALNSGSGFETDRFEEWARKLGARNLKTKNRFTKAEDLGQSHIVLCRAGLSTLSEAIALKKSCVCLPLAHHPEQEINALTVEALGLGIQLGDSKLRTPEAILNAVTALPKVSIRTNGASNAARTLSQIVIQNEASKAVLSSLLSLRK